LMSLLAEELIAHLAGEDAVFYRAVRDVLRARRAATARLRTKRLLLRTQLRRVLETPLSDDSFGPRLGALRACFDWHVEDEERDLFPRAEAALGRAALESLGADVCASRPPIWIVTTEGRPLPAASRHFALRSGISLPIRSRG